MHSITDDLRQQLEAVQEERATARRQRFSRSRMLWAVSRVVTSGVTYSTGGVYL